MTSKASTSLHSSPTIAGYTVVEPLYLGSRTAVYRAVQNDQQRPVVIKVLRRNYPSFIELVQFRNQYAIAKSLPISGIIQPLSLEPLGSGYALVMEDWGGIALGKYVQQQSLTLTEVLAIALQMADILHELCQHRVVHKDIKPANILIHPESKQVKLIDFSIASLLPKETQALQSPNILEGTLAYLAPEQTGRMNRGIDYRADFYSLGVTLYQLLSGILPFASDDPLELMHCHIAKVPVSVDQVNPDLPAMVAAIVTKLMAKNAEDRYQSALGLKSDLEYCLTQWKAAGDISEFELGRRDVSDRFLIPEKLYGREAEVQKLLAAFDRVADGASELMLVAGISGIGKTAVVNEVHKPIVRQRGYFIKGKFDQFNRNIPLSAFVQALRDLMEQLHSDSDAQLAQWRTRILDAVGENGQVLIEVIPELDKIIGKQPTVPELSGRAAQNRFNRLFQKFIGVFTTPDHPLVLFLDDLQWADSASLQLIKLLMNDNGHLLMLGAYRDNEVSLAHPFTLTIEDLKKSQAVVNTLTLTSLAFDDTNHLVADTLNCSRDLAQPMTELIDRKTQGNPFFSTQFLKALYEDKQIHFNCDRGYWECDIAQINALALTDDVVQFMAVQLQKLPPATQQVLKLAACIGNQFDLATLAIVSEQLPTDAATALWKALQEGLILPTSQVYKFFQETDQTTFQSPINLSYRFLHDRIQQAAYCLIPETQKQTTHLKIGRLLLDSISSAEREDKIFNIVNHWNIGAALVTIPSERAQLCQLNLTAAHKAKGAIAYEMANQYAVIAINLLESDSWQNNYALMLELHELAAESAYLSGDFAKAQHWAEIVLQQAQTFLDEVKVHEINLLAYVAQEKLLEAIGIGQRALGRLSISIPITPTDADIEQAWAEATTLIPQSKIQSLFDRPRMTDARALAALQILNSMAATVYLAQPKLLPLIVLAQVKLSLLHGNAPVSAAAYARHSFILCGKVNDIETGYEFGRLALKLSEQFNNREISTRVLLMVGALTLPWKVHLREGISLLQAAYLNGLESGNLDGAALSHYYESQSSYLVGQELQALAHKVATASEQIRQINQELHLNNNELLRQVILNLLSQSKNPCQLVGEAFDETKMLPQYHASSNILGLYCLYLHKLILCYWFGKTAASVEYATLAANYLAGSTAQATVPFFYFYDSLARLAQYTTASKSEQGSILNRVAANQEKIKHWAKHAPMNFQHKYDLVLAEQQQYLGQKSDAINLYDRAIAGAKANEYIQEEALANELAAKFYLNWGKEKIAQDYLTNAYYGYARWGAKAKIQDLEHRYPQLLAPILQQRHMALSTTETIFSTESLTAFQGADTQASTTSGISVSATLDLATVLKASQTLSSEIQLDKLLATLLHTVLENAGADKGALLMPRERQWFVEAVATLDQTAKVESIALSRSVEVPHALINTVKRSLDAVVIVDAVAHPTLAMDAYVVQHQPKSLLCTPILQQGKLVAILYLENHVTTGAFTGDRVALLNFLCAQAAISLENARLYQQAQTYAQQLEKSQLQIVQSEKMASLGNLVAGIAHEINNPIGFLNGSIQNGKDYIQDLLQHLALYQQHYSNPVTAIQEHAEDIDLSFLNEDLPKLLTSMQGATTRIKSISTSLRTFSRADTEHKVSANLHEGLDSTLLILKYRLKANGARPAIQVTQNYGEFPPIQCFPGQLNQVFMNILANAIDVFDEAAQQMSFENLQANPQKITIKTVLTDRNAIEIRIGDNGKGMSEAVKTKIFDHLFTTKEVGKGTGLGLAIARQIVVERHGGSLDVQTELGRGTEFCIYLPMSDDSLSLHHTHSHSLSSVT